MGNKIDKSRIEWGRYERREETSNYLIDDRVKDDAFFSCLGGEISDYEMKGNS